MKTCDGEEHIPLIGHNNTNKPKWNTSSTRSSTMATMPLPNWWWNLDTLTRLLALVVAVSSMLVLFHHTLVDSKTNAAEKKIPSALEVKPLRPSVKSKKQGQEFVTRIDALTNSSDKPFSELFRVFKRTFISSNSEVDAKFLATTLGFQVLDNFTYSNDHNQNATDSYTCAERLEMGPTGYGTLNFEYHLFRSFVTPDESAGVSTSDWVTYFRKLHHHSFVSHKWDAFMTLSCTFFVPSLTSFYERLKNMGILLMRITYVNPVDSIQMYSVLLSVPNTGHIIEITSGNLDASFTANFRSWPDNSCAKANEIGFSVHEMQKTWTAFGGSLDNRYALPSLLLVKMSFPVTNVSLFGQYFHGISGVDVGDVNVVMHATSNSDDEDDGSGSYCSFSNMRFKQAEIINGLNAQVDVRAVVSPSAYFTNYSVADYAAWLEEMHASHLGIGGQGWDRFIDNHIGLYYDNEDLDDIRQRLEDLGEGYHAHMVEKNSSDGTIWTTGFEGQAFEFDGHISVDWAATGLDLFDYCSPTTSKRDENPTPSPVSYHPTPPPVRPFRPTPTQLTYAPTISPKPTRTHR